MQHLGPVPHWGRAPYLGRVPYLARMTYLGGVQYLGRVTHLQNNLEGANIQTNQTISYTRKTRFAFADIRWALQQGLGCNPVHA